MLKQVGVNLLSSDPTSGFKFGIGQGDIAPPAGPGSSPFGVNQILNGTTIGAAGKLFGLDIAGAIDLAETDGLVTTLAEPNLTALSGETASFLAGGEFPIPISQSLGSISIEYKQYGVGLAFTPIVLADGRISMRVRPEVSELSNEGAVELNDFTVPALTTRRAETTVELGSGQSFMIAGLLRNSSTNDINKAPFLGDLPILGALFRSTRYRTSGNRAGDHRHAVSRAPGVRTARVADTTVCARRPTRRASGKARATAARAVRRLPRPPLLRLSAPARPPQPRGSSCDPPLHQEGCQDGF